MFRPISGATLALAVMCVAGAAAPLRAQSPAPASSSSDLDAFMEKVLARREVNRKTLNEYVLDEREEFQILGPGRMRLHRTAREFTWYVRDGMHVRSPVRFEGVPVGEEARDEYERTWIRRELARQERKAKNEKERREIAIGSDGVQITAGGTSPEPRFVSEAYFMDFKFEQGNYYLAGREKLDGIDVLRIEYYPTKLFGDDDKKVPNEVKRESRDQRKERELEDDIERRMNKTALVTLWIDPTLHQIVKYTFDNVWLDFLPGAWLVRVDEMRASMTMGQPFPGVWLPRDININAGFTLANGSFEAGYERAFAKYREAQVKTTIRVPKAPSVQPETEDEAGDEEAERRSGPYVGIDAANARIGAEVERQTPAPAAVPAQGAATEVVREIRVHGNAFLTDEEVLKFAGIEVGAPIAADAVEAIRKRLKDSGRFETVDVRKRYRSLTDPTDVALLLVVHERPGITSATASVNPVVRPWQRFRSGLMFLPILSFADGYGFTYGGRVSAVNTLGIGERLSVPLTWGGTRRAALEFERTFDTGPLTRVTSSAAIWQRENPRFEIDDQRVELKAGIERQFAHMLRLGLDTGRSSVDFGGLKEDLWTLGASAALDTRGNPAFPANAVYLGGGWTGLHVEDRPRINRYHADARGYLRIVGQSVLAGRAQYFNSDAPLPQYERLLLGGSSSLRGFRTGTFDGDRLLITSAELRMPLTSVIRGARFGFTVFADAARAADFGTPFDDVKWQRGVGAGVFMIAPLLKLNLDIARGLDGGGTRVHFGSGFNF